MWSQVMDLSQLRDRCRQVLARLTIPSPFDVQVFCDQIATQRGRSIRLFPMAGGPSPCGLWVATESTDYVFYETSTSPLHRDHIVLHELSHMLCDHRPAPALDDELVHQLFPDLNASLVQRVLARSAYSAADEREAELLASLIREHVDRSGPPAEPDSADVPAAVRHAESTFQ
jgi:hypothetical protein